MQAPTDVSYLYKIYAGVVDTSAETIPSTETDKKDGYIHASTSSQLVGNDNYFSLTKSSRHFNKVVSKC
jgi:uncharacterized protein (DUF952 family)